MLDIISNNLLLTLALIFIAAYPAGLLARKLGVPAVTGNILAGVVLGPSVLGVFESDVAHHLEPLTVFAMGLITVVAGAHLSYRRLHNAVWRISWITFLQVALTLLFVTAGSRWVCGEWQTAVLLGAIAVASAPATVLAVIREERAKGLMVKTLLASVALDNVFCIILFSIVTPQVERYFGLGRQPFLEAFLAPVKEMAISLVLGVVVARILIFLVRKKTIEPFSGLFVAILITVGGAQSLGVFPLLAPLILGVILGNSGRESEDLIPSLESLQPILLTCFFTLAGVDLDLSKMGAMGALGSVYLFGRALGKVAGGFGGALLAGTTETVRNHVGPALIPQAGITIGMVVILQGETAIPSEITTAITNVVLATVVLNELFGPPLVRRAIHKAGENDKARRRIVEFLQEEHIKVPFHAENKWDAIRQLAEFLIRTHGIQEVTVDDLVASVEERERSISTAMGSGVAIPHAKIPSGPDIVGVMGVSDQGIDFDAPDGQPVHFIIMIATPKEHQEKHLQVMAAVARIISDSEVRARLLIARNPAEAFEAIETDTTEDYNYFLEE